MDKKPEALASAGLDGLAKLDLCEKNGITPKMSKAEQNKLVEKWSKAKAAKTGEDIKDVRPNQRWFVEHLMEFVGLEPIDQVNTLYRKQFVKQANEAELVDAFASYKKAS
jgi:hypothetical protein